MAIPILLDTDIGTDIDDVYALILAASSPELDLRAVTTVNNDTELHEDLLRILGRERRKQLTRVRPDPARDRRPQLIDVEGDLHRAQASTHIQPSGPTVAAWRVPAGRSNRSPARRSTSPSSVWKTIDPSRQKSTLCCPCSCEP